MGYRKIHDEISSDPDFAALSNCAQHVYLLLVGHYALTTMGTMRQPIFLLSDDYGTDADYVGKGIDELKQNDFVKYNCINKLLFVKSFLKYNKPFNANAPNSWPNLLTKMPACEERDFAIAKAIDFCVNTASESTKRKLNKDLVEKLTSYLQNKNIVDTMYKQCTDNVETLSTEEGIRNKETRIRKQETTPSQSFIQDKNNPEQAQPALLKTSLVKVHREEINYLIELNRELNGWDEPIKPSGDNELRMAQGVERHGLDKCQLAIHGHIWRQKDFARQKGEEPEYTQVWYAFPCIKKSGNQKTSELDDGQFLALAKLGENRKPKQKKVRPVDRRARHPDGEHQDAHRRYNDGIWENYRYEALQVAWKKGLKDAAAEEFAFEKANADFLAEATRPPDDPEFVREEIKKAREMLGIKPKSGAVKKGRGSNNREHPDR